MLVVALLLQIATAYRIAPNPSVPLVLIGALLLVSYAGVLAGIWFNRALPGMWLIGIGVLLNVVVTLPYGGLMPTTPDALRMAGRPVPAQLPGAGARPYIISKDIVLPRDEIPFPLWVISDRFVIPRGWPLAGEFSPGDVVVAVGFAWLLARGMAVRSEPLGTGPSTTGSSLAQ
jgi:hypothetical protein